MVDSLNDSHMRMATPTPAQNLRDQVHSLNESTQSPISSSSVTSAFYDPLSNGTRNIHFSSTETLGGLTSITLASKPGDASGSVPDSVSMPDRNKAGPSRRRSRSQSTAANRSTQKLLPPTTQVYAPISIPEPPASANYQGHYPPAGPSYPQRPPYVGQYTISTPPLTMSHNPSYPYPHSHPFHHGTVPDGSMVAPNIHAGFQSMVPSHVPVYPYQHHPLEGSVAIPGSHSSPIYPHTPSNPSLPSTPLSVQGNSHSSSYFGAGQFHPSVHYPSPISTPQYAYPTQSFSTPPPLYQTHYNPGYSQLFSPEQESPHGGTWFYMVHPAVPSPHPAAPSYQGHYPVQYPTMSRHDVDNAYSAPASTSVSLYSVSPAPQSFSSTPDIPSPPSPILSADPNPPTKPQSLNSTTPAGLVQRPVVRRSYHPNPPAQRSEWVMWAGNVPSDATHVELWRFFNNHADDGAENPAIAQSQSQAYPVPEDTGPTGVLSIFLISRSNCAFINFENEENLLAAIANFNGLPLRASDPRCPRLVCRVRRKDDDLKAGVGAQRGMGMHTRWVKEKDKGKGRALVENDVASSPSSASDQLSQAVSSLSMSSDEDGRRLGYPKHSSSSESYASTNSDFLKRYFPQRYFILKSLTQYDLDLSVQRGLWATQKHNEGILDQAFRTSTDVFLIFGVNKSGEFYGYARMSGPVESGDDEMPWASRPTSPSSRASHSPISSRLGVPGGKKTTTQSLKNAFFTPGSGRLVDSSPIPVDHPSARMLGEDDNVTPGPSIHHTMSAPAELGQPHQKFTLRTPAFKYSLDNHNNIARDVGADNFELDPSAPIRAMRPGQAPSMSTTGADEQEKIPLAAVPTLDMVAEEEGEVAGMGEEEREIAQVGEEERDGEGEDKDEAWGHCFKVEWLCTDRLPFYRTRHLRNPWNHDREVKVSRDGTELEPSMGQRLLDEWGHLAEPQVPSLVVDARPPAGPKRTNARSAPPMGLHLSRERGSGAGPSTSRS